jgi:hypothetical protein
MSDKHPTENSTALIIGGEVKTVGLAVAGRLFVFTPNQMQFLLNLQKLKNVTAAALSIDKPEEWGQAFLKSRKFRDYIACKMQEFSVKNGLTVEWWYQFGKWTSEGYRDFYEVKCPYCPYRGEMTTYEVESYRHDDMTLEVPCPVCYKPMLAQEMKEDFRPSREQVVAWQDLGARLIPKVERIHHAFENVDIKFESEEAQNG